MNNIPQSRQVRPVAPYAPAPKRLSKHESLRIVRALKRVSLVASTLAFGGFIALVARHNVHAGTNSSSGDTSGTATPSTQFNSPRDNGSNDFFNNQGQGSYGFGTGNNLPPVTGSSTS